MRKHRPSIDLPKQLVADVAACADTAGTYPSYLYYHWVLDAARLAERGFGHLLPQEKRAPRGSIGETDAARWLQSKADFRRCQALIDGAGSSVAAVLRHASRRYLEAGGDAVAMTWPPKSALAAVA